MSLRPRYQEPTVELGQLLHELQDRASYDLAIDYTADPVPRLEEDTATWVAQLLQETAMP
jgi:hypothetical protein